MCVRTRARVRLRVYFSEKGGYRLMCTRQGGQATVGDIATLEIQPFQPSEPFITCSTQAQRSKADADEIGKNQLGTTGTGER
jgi:hypothetical protein